MESLEKLLGWAKLDQWEARAEAADKLRRCSTTQDEVVPALQALTTLVADPDIRVARVVIARDNVTGWRAPTVYLGGLRSPHAEIRESCRQQLAGLNFTWEKLTTLGLEPAQALEFVDIGDVVRAIVDGDDWCDLAMQRLKADDLIHFDLHELRALEAALRERGGDASMVADYLASKRGVAVRNRSVPRAKKTEHVDAFVRDVLCEDVDSAQDYVHMLKPGDWAALSERTERLPAELRDLIVEAVGGGPAAGLFFLLHYLEGPYAETAARGIAQVCETFAIDVALTRDEYATVRQVVAEVPEPFLID
jgi:hypothetical protein